MRFKVVPESGTRNSDFERGFVQIVDHIQSNEVRAMNDSGFGKFVQTASTAFMFSGFNLDKAPFDDVKVRRVVSMAFRKDLLVNSET